MELIMASWWRFVSWGFGPLCDLKFPGWKWEEDQAEIYEKQQQMNSDKGMKKNWTFWVFRKFLGDKKWLLIWLQ